MFTYEIKIPLDRVAVLIGKKGFVKNKIQKNTKTKLIINSKEGNVIIKGEDSFLAYNTQLIIKAIGRGFNPNIALLLKKEDYCLEIVDITDFAGRSKKKMHRMKARLIGTQGKVWKTLERLTNCNLSIYGKTVSIIGHIDMALVAKKAVEDIIKGAPHGNIYKFLQEKRIKIKIGL